MQPVRGIQPPQPSVRTRQTGLKPLLRYGLWLVLLGGLCGCASKRPFTPSTLPAQWQARPTSNARTVGLSRLVSDTRPLDQIAKGDVIEVNLAASLAADDATTFQMRINQHGFGIIPDVGPVHLEGMSLEGAESVIRNECIQRQYIRNPHVTVTMKERKTLQVTVVGGVEKEGTYFLPSGSAGLIQAISAAGGLADDAGTGVEISYGPTSTPQPEREREKYIAESGPNGTGIERTAGMDADYAGQRVPVRTEGPRTVKIDLASFGQQDSQKLALQDGATVQVERIQPPRITVQGQVHKPDTYDVDPGKEYRLLDVISKAGGESSLAADKVFVIRNRPEYPEPALIQASIRKAKKNGMDNLLLEPGDIVTVEQTPGTMLLEAVRIIGFNISARAL
ncbi:polysaccharide biosynthesis/export family protein [Planctomicrobium sp. SH664]|uniref:polysaccharide biosynthesis/export family protein n=1 Tax=Planctomicrobium sp. SH664 TaxID=3448125 RepID=UPI003F5CBAC9